MLPICLHEASDKWFFLNSLIFVVNFSLNSFSIFCTKNYQWKSCPNVSSNIMKLFLKSVCEGQPGCAQNTARWKITPLSKCNLYPMYPLSNILCNGSKPHNCPKTIGLFADHMAGDGACGAVDGNWCARGQDYVSLADKPLYAYCAI